jgi:hypothetical protein
VDDEFGIEIERALDKVGQKRRKKHFFNEEGIAFEPFNIRRDIADGLITQEGALIHRKKAGDAWLDSITD